MKTFVAGVLLLLSLGTGAGQSTCSEADKAWPVLDHRYGDLSPWDESLPRCSTCTVDTQDPSVGKLCYPALDFTRKRVEIYGTRGLLPTDYLLRLDSPPLSGYPSIDDAVTATVDPQYQDVYEAVVEHMVDNCGDPEWEGLAEEERAQAAFSKWAVDARSRCGVSVTNRRVSSDTEFDNDCFVAFSATQFAQCTAASLGEGTCTPLFSDMRARCEQLVDPDTGVVYPSLDLASCINVGSGESVRVNCFDQEFALQGAEEKKYRSEVNGVLATRNVWAKVEEQDDAYLITGVGRFFCADLSWVQFSDDADGARASREGRYDLVDIEVRLDKAGASPAGLPAGAFEFAAGEAKPSWISKDANNAGVTGTVRVLCGVDNPEQRAKYDGNIAGCDEYVELVGERRASGECTLPPEICEDSFTYLGGKREDYPAATPEEEEELEIAFANGLEFKNYMAGWVKVRGCAGNGSCSGSFRAGSPGVYTMDINGVVPDVCLPNQVGSLFNDAEDVAVQGDPHLVGFQGSHFDYTGVPGTYFALLSAAGVQLNAFLIPELVNGLTYMGAVGVAVGQYRVRLSSMESSQHITVTVNDEVVDLSAGEVVSLGGGDVTLQQQASGNVAVVLPGSLRFAAHLHLGQFLDLASVALLRDFRAGEIHGVLGCTAVREAAGFEGAEADYVVSDLWSSDFKYSVTGGARHRKMGAVAAVTPATVAAILNE